MSSVLRCSHRCGLFPHMLVLQDTGEHRYGKIRIAAISTSLSQPADRIPR